ncbi:L-2-hydroxyglutarate oxidase [Streptomyces sp. ST2-7A]|uniref:L-2-hydroxyglutarate oxidase n=1 Tax=Streptomyces sp. ST2-7A TaxID=2907214 RepID=UPI001F238B71|nr:L-2-hydroxyglutarate oxidase [Streptomyces sp. ST2-7A]MCE7079468.1 L-2-hydroxyglutarate oxidase [Streptomyces sp. ST2-7A]
MADETVGIVGAGIVGLAVGREITLRRPGTSVVVFEKEDSIGAHQTGHNSGVVHAGIYYAPGSLKARLCTRGRSMLREYCVERGLPYEECGKLVVAVTPGELPRLERLASLAEVNGVPGLRRLVASGITDVEPHALGLAALHSPRTAITDFVRIAEEFGRDIVSAGGEILLGRGVTAVHRERRGGLRVVAGGHAESVSRLVVCAGLHADRVGRLVSDTAEPRIVPFRGEYMRVRASKAGLVRGMIYPVPDPRYPFLGVHFTRRVGGGLEVGPNAVPAMAREGYQRWRVDPRELLRIASWPGSGRLVARHWRTGLREMRGSLSVRAYLRDARRYVPDIGPADVVRAGAGVRAQALDRDGTLVDDFRVHRLGGVTVVRNAPSPAATSSMAIAEHIVTAMGRGD